MQDQNNLNAAANLLQATTSVANGVFVVQPPPDALPPKQVYELKDLTALCAKDTRICDSLKTIASNAQTAYTAAAALRDIHLTWRQSAIDGGLTE